ncbi:MAG: alpha/beta hydrolase [Alsobacter sp.]
MSPFVHPQMAAILAEFLAAPAVDVKTLPIDQARRMSDAASAAWSAGAPDIPATELVIPGPRPMRARLYRPAGRHGLPLVLFVHGGGWTFGSIDTHDGTMRHLAVEAGCAVLGFDYRLAPENPFPAPLEDTLSAAAFVRAGGLGPAVDHRRLAFAGDSAGATLALSAMLRLRDAGEPLPAAAALFYGCYAPVFDTPSHRDLGEGFLLTSVNMRWYWRNYLGAAFDAPPPLAAPLGAELGGLPPLYLAAAGLDPLRDDTTLLAGRLAEAGVAFRYDHVPGVVHGCLRMSRRLAPAHTMIAAAGRFLAEALNEQNQEENADDPEDPGP